MIAAHATVETHERVRTVHHAHLLIGRRHTIAFDNVLIPVFWMLCFNPGMGLLSAATVRYRFRFGSFALFQSRHGFTECCDRGSRYGYTIYKGFYWSRISDRIHGPGLSTSFIKVHEFARSLLGSGETVCWTASPRIGISSAHNRHRSHDSSRSSMIETSTCR